MKFVELQLGGVFRISLEPKEDERGWFARTFSSDEFDAHGLVSSFPQCSISSNTKKGTVRGMHYQVSPHEEAKIVHCIRGSMMDVVLDLRPESPTYKQHVSAELTANNHTMLYIPPGLAHGFQTLEDDTQVYYQISAPYTPESARGVRWDDPAFTIHWPLPISIISDRDATFPTL